MSMMKVAKRSMSTGKGRSLNTVILGSCRTPIGGFNGSLSSVKGTELGSIAVREALRRSNIAGDKVDEVIMGNVISSGSGQAPARQVALGAGLSNKTVCTTINKVCASGMKSTMMGALTIGGGINNVVVSGGFESMSNIPFYLPKGRKGYGLGHGQVQDGIILDGLWDVYGDTHMGNCAEVCAEKYQFSRADQDAYALESYRRANAAIEAGLFKDEIVGVPVTSRGATVLVTSDEEPKNLNVSKVPSLKPAFKKDGTITAANASSLNDGACAIVMASEEYAHANNLKPVARIIGFGDAAAEPLWFTTAPSLAIPVALKHAGLTTSDVHYWELNEAFSVVSLVNNRLLGLDASRVNVNGGAVALGHPIGCSGARIITTLLSVLKQKDATIGVASICNGGGGASAIVIERLV